MGRQFNGFTGLDHDNEFVKAEEIIDGAEQHNTVGMILRMFSEKYGNDAANELVEHCNTKENWGIGKIND